MKNDPGNDMYPPYWLSSKEGTYQNRVVFFDSCFILCGVLGWLL